MGKNVNLKSSSLGRFTLLSLNIYLITLLFSFFELIFRFVKFILIYKELDYLWNLYSNYYLLISLLFTLLWILTSYFLTTYFYKNNKRIL